MAHEIARLDRRAAGGQVGWRRDDDDLRDADPPDDKGRLGRLGDPDRKIELFFDQAGMARARDEFHANGGKAREKPRNPRQNVAFAETLGKRDPDQSRGRHAQRARLCPRDGRLVQKPLASRVKQTPGLRRSYAPRRALEQPDAQTLLERANGVADGGLRGLQSRRSPGEAAALDDAGEGLESGEAVHGQLYDQPYNLSRNDVSRTSAVALINPFGALPRRSGGTYAGSD